MGSCQDFKEVVKSRPHTDSAVGEQAKMFLGIQNNNDDDNHNYQKKLLIKLEYHIV